MPMSDRAKEQIDAMPKDELILEINKGIRSRFQQDSYSYLQTRLDILNNQDEDLHRQQTIEIAQEANRISREANDLSNKSIGNSYRANWISGLALFVAIVAAFISYFHK